MTLATIHGAGVAVATAILSCDLSIDVVDKDDCHDDEDDIYDNFLHSCLNPKLVIKKQITIIKIILSTNYHNYLKSASNLNGNLNCSKELEHYAS